MIQPTTYPIALCGMNQKLGEEATKSQHFNEAQLSTGIKNLPKFLLRGHTHMEADHVHPLIERSLKKQPTKEICTPWEGNNLKYNDLMNENSIWR